MEKQKERLHSMQNGLGNFMTLFCSLLEVHLRIIWMHIMECYISPMNNLVISFNKQLLDFIKTLK